MRSGTVFYINNQLPRRATKIENLSDIEILTTERAISKNKILFPGIYKPLNLIKINFTTSPETIISKLSNKYEKLILMVDFNMTTRNSILGQSLDNFVLLIQLVFQNPKSPSCVDVILTVP